MYILNQCCLDLVKYNSMGETRYINLMPYVFTVSGKWRLCNGGEIKLSLERSFLKILYFFYHQCKYRLCFKSDRNQRKLIQNKHNISKEAEPFSQNDKITAYHHSMLYCIGLSAQKTICPILLYMGINPRRKRKHHQFHLTVAFELFNLGATLHSSQTLLCKKPWILLFVEPHDIFMKHLPRAYPPARHHLDGSPSRENTAM